MSAFKQVHMKFWQNDFVLGLTPEERYFYIYLITNSMTTQCGIYKFNRRLAELETGYNLDKIEELLKRFQDYEKVIISKSSAEIMLVNWFKHNFKGNKKMISLINKELRDVKDKELLKILYDSCSSRQYPVAEIFKGAALPGVEIEELMLQEEGLLEAAIERQKEINSDTGTQVEKDIEISVDSYESSIVVPVPDVSVNEVDTGSIFTGLKKSSTKLLKGRKRKKEKPAEELVSMEGADEEEEKLEGGTVEAFWSFAADVSAGGHGKSP